MQQASNDQLKKLLAAIKEAERVSGEPGSVPLISAVYFHQNPEELPFSQFNINNWLQNYYREDLFYSDPKFKGFSLERFNDNFENFSERSQRIFPDYSLDSTMHFTPIKNTLTINLDQLIKLMRSKDENLWNLHKTELLKGTKFLDGSTFVG